MLSSSVSTYCIVLWLQSRQIITSCVIAGRVQFILGPSFRKTSAVSTCTFAHCILKFLTTDNEIDGKAFLELTHTEVCDLVGPNKLEKINRI